MGKQTRTHLKEKFNDGKKPTGKDFSDLIDSFVNQEDDKVGVGENGVHIPDEVAIGTEIPNEKLTIDGAISLRELQSSPNATNGFGKLYVKEEKLVSAEFDGNDSYISMPSLDIADVRDFTIGTWFKVDQKTTGIRFLVDLRKKSVNTAALRYTIRENGQCQIEHFVEWPQEGSSSRFAEGVGFIFDEWHHTALVRKGGELQVFFDGKMISKTPASGPINVDKPIPWNSAWKVNNHFLGDYGQIGQIDELGLWTRALDLEEVKSIFLAGRDLDLREKYNNEFVSYWRMGDGEIQNGTITDQIEPSRKGTLKNVSFYEEKIKALHFRDSSGSEVVLGGGSSLGSGSAGSVWSKNGGDIFYESGNVGVGASEIDLGNGEGIFIKANTKGNAKVVLEKGEASGGINVSDDANGLYLNSDRGISFYPNNKQAATITSDGNLGMGTASPAKDFHIQGHNSAPFVNDGNDRPGIAITGHYPELTLFSSMNNPNHGPTIRMGGYSDDSKNSFKHWVIGTSARNSSFLDIGIGHLNDPNPHAGIRNYMGRTVLILNENGSVWAQTRTGGRADYAEYFESKSGKSLEDGVSVVLDQGKIRPAKKDETPIGIISTSPVMLGNSPNEWPEKYLMDDFGNILMEPAKKSKKGDKNPLPEIPKLNPKYDPKKEYVQRSDRPEWNIVGLLGQLPMRKGQPVAPSWVKIKNISKDVELWLVK